MNRSVALIVPILCLLAAGCGVRSRQTPPKALAPPAAAAKELNPQPLSPPPAYLTTATDFFQNWESGETGRVYLMLTKRMQKLISEKDFSKQLAEVTLSQAKPLAYTGNDQAAYVVMSVEAVQPKGGLPVAGYSVLLKKENGRWRVALFLQEEKLPQKIENLFLRDTPKGYVVTYTNEKGQVATDSLVEP